MNSRQLADLDRWLTTPPDDWEDDEDAEDDGWDWPAPTTYGPDDDLSDVQPGDIITLSPTAYDVARENQK